MDDATTSIGCISAEKMYTLQAVKAHAGLGVSALRTARRNGLKVRRIGRLGFVLGKDLIAYVERATS